MIIRWIGHASFRIALDSGLSIVTDPFDPSVGYDLPTTRADIVTMSHNHHDHNYIGALNPAHIVCGVGEHAFSGVTVTGYPSFHDDVGGAKRGSNTIFRIQAEGLNIVHLGDLGHALTDAEISALDQVDVLMIPVGGVFTLDAHNAAELARRINAGITVPMHYQTDRLSFPLGSVQDFITDSGLKYAALDAMDPSDPPAPVILLNYGQGL